MVARAGGCTAGAGARRLHPRPDPRAGASSHRDADRARRIRVRVAADRRQESVRVRRRAVADRPVYGRAKYVLVDPGLSAHRTCQRAPPDDDARGVACVPRSGLAVLAIGGNRRRIAFGFARLRLDHGLRGARRVRRGRVDSRPSISRPADCRGCGRGGVLGTGSALLSTIDVERSVVASGAEPVLERRRLDASAYSLDRLDGSAAAARHRWCDPSD